ncbi:MAG: PspC domain-containing protein [Candidatus Paceibacterota bacterium]
MANNVKKLYRSSTDKIIFGVCGGLAEYLEVDSLIIRIIFLFLVFAGGSGVFIYLILALLMPKDPVKQTRNIGEEAKKITKELVDNAKDNSMVPFFQNIAGILIIVIGLNLLFKEIFKVDLFGWMKWEIALSLLIILIGVNIVGKQK